MQSGGAKGNNFWLWGVWGKRSIRDPFLTQKVDEKIRNVIIGNQFILALKEDGSLVSWGEDKNGCLGLGIDLTNSADPKRVNFRNDQQDKVVDIQFGKKHVLALTTNGKVYAWGENSQGQLGLGDAHTRYEPQFVETLMSETVIQILAVDNMSYALTNHGNVWAWGENKDGALALAHENTVNKPEPMMSMKETVVKKLEVKESAGAKAGKVIIAYVELADPLSPQEQIGGFSGPLGASPLSDSTQDALASVPEREIFEGVDLMRKVMDNTQDWWNEMLDVRHGSPYDDNPTQVDEDINARPVAVDDNATAMQLDIHVSLDNLERASYRLDMLINSAKSQIVEIKHKRGTKNVKFMLTMFMDNCKLRREKIRRTVAARQLMDHKKMTNKIQDPSNTGNREDFLKGLRSANQQLVAIKDRVSALKTYDVFTRNLQESILECLECKKQVHEVQMEVLKAQSGKHADPILPSLRIIKDRWGALKHFSIYNLYQECSLRGQNVNFNSEDEMLAFLVQSSDAKIDQIINIDRDPIISRDLMVPALCYDLLRENAELRKMCNTYQLKVLIQMENDKKSKSKDDREKDTRRAIAR